ENSPEENFSPGISGEENGSMNTFFLDSTAGDYRVLSGGAIDRADPTDPYAKEPSPNGGRRNRGAFGDTPWAAPSPAIFAAPEEQKGGGGCGALGLEFLLFLGLLRLARRGTRS
ncbi:MAG: hypothetical protein QF645_11250, partial [Planctomycetota bacterium]|nr:hypothetical protein [Planctomycetota bacterium]